MITFLCVFWCLKFCGFSILFFCLQMQNFIILLTFFSLIFILLINPQIPCLRHFFLYFNLSFDSSVCFLLRFPKFSFTMGVFSFTSLGCKVTVLKFSFPKSGSYQGHLLLIILFLENGQYLPDSLIHFVH